MKIKDAIMDLDDSLQTISIIVDNASREFISKSTTEQEMLGVDTTAATGTNCIFVNGLGMQLLRGLGYNAVLAGGRAAFSVNESARGILDFGYGANAITALGHTDSGFHGHCWIELVGFNLIIDFTMANLKAVFMADNKRRGITNNDFNITTSLTFEQRENKSFKRLFDGELGRNYDKQMPQHIEMLTKLGELQPILNKAIAATIK